MSDKPDKRERLAELLSTSSKNFLGTGLTFEEFMQRHRAEQIAASWVLQSAEEKRRRRQAVIRLSQELGRIEETTKFSARLCELAIESVIEGDWTMVQEWAEHFAFVPLHEQEARAFATFRELLLQVLRTDKELPA